MHVNYKKVLFFSNVNVSLKPRFLPASPKIFFIFGLKNRF